MEFDTPQPNRMIPPTYPRTVRIAGRIWIGVGSVIWLGGFAMLVNSIVNSFRSDPASIAVSIIVFGGLIGLFGWAFVTAGFRAVRGTGNDIVGSAAASAALGFLACYGMEPNTLAFGILLVVASVLALAGRGEYLAWRARPMDEATRSAAVDPPALAPPLMPHAGEEQNIWAALPFRAPNPSETTPLDAIGLARVFAGWFGIAFGGLAVACALLGIVTCGATAYATPWLGGLGLVCSVAGRGFARGAGLVLNGFILFWVGVYLYDHR